jgi:hypothetical protein
MSNLRKRHIYLPVILGVLTPSLVIFILEVFVSHISPAHSVAHILYRQFAKGHNLFLIMAFGLIPFAILIGVTALFSLRLKGKQLDCVFYGGLIGILVLMIPGHISVWFPLYIGARMSSTAVLAFIFIPFYCIVTMCIGLLIGLAILLLPSMKADKPVMVICPVCGAPTFDLAHHRHVPGNF